MVGSIPVPSSLQGVAIPTTLTLPTSVRILQTNFDVCLSVHRREENQLDATECFIAIIICSTCFGRSYAHHQELETILVLLLHMVCNALVAGSRLFGVEQQVMCAG